MSLCERNCNYDNYNITTKRVTCKCNIKRSLNSYSDIFFKLDIFLDKFTNFKKHSNIGVVKCYKNLFKKDGLINNIGSYILLTIILINIILSIIFCAKGHKSLFDLIFLIISLKKQNKYSNLKKKLRSSYKIFKNKNAKSKEIKNNYNIWNSLNSPTKKKFKINNTDQSNKSLAFLNYKKLKGKENEINKINIDNNKNNIKIFKKSNNKKIGRKAAMIDFNEYELNSMPFNEALQYDKRTYWQYYFSILKINELLLFSFYPNFDFNSKIIKISLFFISFSLFFAVNALFFTDSTMHKIYINKGIFDKIYQIPILIYSSIISGLINYLLKFLSLSQKYFLEIKREKSFKLLSINTKKVKVCLNIKFIIFYIFSFLLLAFFWYYISCFCVIYSNTQLFLIEDTFYSFALSLIYPVFICLLPGILRISSLNSEKKRNKIIYSISKILQLI